MPLLPFKEETIILPYPAREARRRLQRLTRPVGEGLAYTTTEERQFLFNGLLKGERFRISRKLVRPENFLPLLVGHIEATSVGCLVFVRYRLFFATAMYLVFWSVVCVLMGLFFLIHQEAWGYAAIAFGLGFIQYLIAIKNFSLQVKRSRTALDQAFFSELSPPV
jgi:hypothetical protein